MINLFFSNKKYWSHKLDLSIQKGNSICRGIYLYFRSMDQVKHIETERSLMSFIMSIYIHLLFKRIPFKGFAGA